MSQGCIVGFQVIDFQCINNIKVVLLLLSI